jgi:glutaredoxin 3
MLLESKAIEYREHPVDSGGELKQEMIQRSGGRMTVPQIFIDDRHLGGCDDLYELDRRGVLDELFAN